MPPDRLPSLPALRAFQTVARCGSFSGAAEILGLTQSGVSRQIARLEADVGAALFERSASGTTLTATGEEYAQQVGAALDALAQLGQARVHPRDRDQVILACSRGVADLWLLPRLGALRAAMPGLELKLRVENNFAHLRRDEYDLALYHRPQLLPDFAMEPMGPEEMVPVMAPGQPPLADQDRPLILAMEETFKEWDDWGNWLFAAGLVLPDATLRWKLGDYRLAIDAARRGIGVAMGWTWLVADLIAAGELVPAHLFRLTGAGRYWLMRPLHRHQRQATRRVADWLLAANTNVTGV